MERGFKKHISATVKKRKAALYYIQSKATHFKNELKFSQAITNGNTLVLPFKKEKKEKKNQNLTHWKRIEPAWEGQSFFWSDI